MLAPSPLRRSARVPNQSRTSTQRRRAERGAQRKNERGREQERGLNREARGHGDRRERGSSSSKSSHCPPSFPLRVSVPPCSRRLSARPSPLCTSALKSSLPVL